MPFLQIFGDDTVTENNMSIETALSMMYILSYVCIFAIWIDMLLSIIKNDEKSLWINYTISLPATVKGQVQSKYCEGLIISSVYFNWCFTITELSIIINNADNSNINIIVAFMCMLLFIYAIEIPFSFKFGAKYGNDIKFIFGMILIIAFLIFMLYGKDTKSTLFKLWEMLLNNDYSDNIIFINSLFPYTVGILYYVSYKISCKIYLKVVERFE